MGLTRWFNFVRKIFCLVFFVQSLAVHGSGCVSGLHTEQYVSLSKLLTVRKSGDILHSFLNAALDAGKRSASRPGRFATRKEAQYPLKRGFGGPQNGCGRCGKWYLQLQLYETCMEYF